MQPNVCKRSFGSCRFAHAAALTHQTEPFALNLPPPVPRVTLGHPRGQASKELQLAPQTSRAGQGQANPLPLFLELAATGGGEL